MRPLGSPSWRIDGQADVFGLLFPPVGAVSVGEAAEAAPHSHSIVPGGFDVTS